jgi:phage tail-like protein
MARAGTTDYLQGFRFHVTKIDGQGGPEFVNTPINGGQAGFQSVTLPEISADVVEYREGIFKYTKKFQGLPTVSSMTLMRGIALGDTAFFDWIMGGLNGTEYRCDLQVQQFARDSGTTTTQTEVSPDSITRFRTLKAYECVPTRVKAMADLDATSADVSMAEVDIELEYFEIIDTLGEVAPEPG